MKILVVGGTGMLAEASREMAKHARKLTLLARSPATLAEEIGAHAISMDWSDKDTVKSAITILQNDGPPDLLVSWIHNSGLWCLSDFETLLAPGGRSIRIHGSAAGHTQEGIKTDPIAPGHITRQNVVLGWVSEQGTCRWLDHHEISAGVLYAFYNPKKLSNIVGTLN